MATDSVQFEYWEGETLTADVFPLLADTAHSTGRTVTENTNNKGTYRFTVVSPVANQEYLVNIKSGSSVVHKFRVVLKNDGTVHTPTEPADMKALDGSPQAAQNERKALTGVLSGTVDATGFTPTVTQFETSSFVLSTTDLLNGISILVISGARKFERSRITGCSLQSGRTRLTFQEMTGAMADGDEFVVV